MSGTVELQTAVSAWCIDSATAAAIYGLIRLWDTSNVTDMSYLIYSYCSSKKKFNEDLSLWDVSRVTSFKKMFGYATKFNADISAWGKVPLLPLDDPLPSALPMHHNSGTCRACYLSIFMALNQH